jgi:proline iminopeptidase
MNYSLYPAIEPYKIGRLKVSDIHELYFEESGNPQGQPVVFVHGGPGGGTAPDHRCFFDPAHYRIILFDQRGCGKSTPHADLRDNTTWHLVEDMEKLRTHLQIEKWIVFGGSWGSTLSLIYAETYPERVKGLALRGIFLCREKEIKWFYQEGASRIFPDAWDIYISTIPENERDDFVSAYYKRLTSENQDVRLQAAITWSVWEMSTSRLIPDEDMRLHGEDAVFAEAFSRIECHYFINKIWLKSDHQILDDVHRIRHIPCEIVHGRYDVVCPVESAWELKKAWPECSLHITPDAGHAAKEPGTSRKLVEIMERFKTL